MSTPFYDLASLVVVPSGYKASKVYAQKPLTTDGQLTFSRASTATRVNSAGLIETVSSNVPRLDYTNSSCPKLLLEPSRANSLRNSQNFGAWTIQGAATRTTGITDPGGGTTAATISNISTTGDFSDGIRLDNNAVTINANDTLCFSVYLKGSGTIGLALERAVSGTYFFVTTMVTLTADWKRHTFTTTVANAASGFQAYVCNKTGSTATSFSIAFGQVEIGAYPTSYIPTTTAAVTRLAEGNLNFSALVNNTSFTLFFEGSYTKADPNFFDLLVGVNQFSGNYFSFYNGFMAIYNAGGGTQTFGTALSPNTVHKLLIKYDGTTAKYYRNGQLFLSIPATGLGTFGDGYVYNNDEEGLKIKQLLYFPTALTDAQCIEITTP